MKRMQRAVTGAMVAAACGAALAAGGPELGYSGANMDRRISPRKDFYGYANGQWLQRTDIPASQADVSGFNQLGLNLQDQLLRLVQDAAASRDAAAGSPRQQVGDYFRAAMDTQRLDALGITPLQADFEHLQQPQDPASLGALSARLESAYGVSPLVNALMTPDARNSSQGLLVIHPGMQALDREEYTQPDGQRVRELYRAFVARMIQTLGESPAQASAHAQQVLDMETALASARLDKLASRDPARTYNILSFADAQALVPALDLRALLAGLQAPVPERVQVIDIAGLQAVQQLLASRTPEELRTLLRWHILSAHAGELGQPWQGLDREFSRQRRGLQEAQAREREVVDTIGAQLYHPLSQLYVQAYFPESTRRDIRAMVGHVKDEFAQRLQTNPWLDAPTRAAALEKLARVDIQVGYPEEWVDFSSVVIRPDDHLGNVQRINAFMLQRELSQAGGPVRKDRFAAPRFTTPIAVNAAYNPQSNSIDITAAIVQAPFYKPGADPAVNYCTIGAVIGHELTHGFDSFGRQFGPAGNLRDWWTPQATAEFKARTDVLVQQYSTYTLLPGLTHNGALTLTENTADLGGITLGYAALQRALAGKPQPRVDGLTTDQRCFVAWAQLWAYKARPERVRLLAATDYHANSSLRGFAPLLHLDAFHKAFGTRPGDAMWRAPKDRVRIW